ncbi:MAG TPA: family 16 glycoside hydrolase [Candidatus Acidoferrum sp.]|jgi:hypothetical protein|nr:family 16 glycoside hydrolase [Candidatus Acidoferrum sp.]
MKNFALLALGASTFLLSGAIAPGEVKIVIDHNDNEHASAAFKFKNVPPPSGMDAATKAEFSVVDGVRDANGGDLDKLHDGKGSTAEDQPGENFFFDAGTDGGRVSVDLGAAVAISQVNTYSWHPRDRGPQLYKLYGADGKADGFNARPKKGSDPEACGWNLVAKVDTRPKSGDAGGQYGVSIADSEGKLGSFQYLLFDISRTEDTDDFGNTFFSEVDVVGEGGAADTAGNAPGEPYVTRSSDGYCEIAIDTSGAPDLKDWAENKLAPVLAEWYPKIAAMLASDGYNPPKAFRVLIRPGRGVAATGGTNVTVNSAWLKNELTREGVGAILHEEVHVIQRYGGGRRANPDVPRVRPPGWLVEGIPDYIRWFIYEPQSHGADITWLRTRRNLSLKYDAGYRMSANFLNYVVETYDKGLIKKLNATCREGKSTDDLWKAGTGKTLAELGDEWKTSVDKQIAAPPVAETINSLTEVEKAAGWKLLFNGTDFSGWHNFKREGVRPGWEVKDGALVCADPHNAGDIVTPEKFGWFELQLDYNISEAGNSGIMYHVTDEGNAVWATGPEFQLEDNVKAADPVRCGWLYALYQPPTDPNTGKPLDATKPVGQWNHVRLLISPEKCVHEINGVKYFEYVLGSDDFNARVAKSKFGRMPRFAKSDSGYLALQGDHGRVEFRNIKIRPLQVGQ